MTLGTPVLTSKTSSVPELAGDACLLVDPYKVEEIRKGILALASDADLCAELSKRGLARAQVFSLDAYRERMNSLYSKLT
jgi:glycosyltransferase involved in cell wall biosynthesis